MRIKGFCEHLSTRSLKIHNMKRKATILGSTGLIGQQLSEILKKDPEFDQINLVVRRQLTESDPKVNVSADISTPEGARMAGEQNFHDNKCTAFIKTACRIIEEDFLNE